MYKRQVLGDVNEDSKVNIFDSVLIRKYLLTGEAEINYDNADMNDDGTVNVADLVMLNSFLIS